MRVVNKKAYYDYRILDRLEAGVVLSGGEAKSVHSGRIQLSGAYVRILNDGVYLINAVIHEYEHANVDNYQPDRSRKLLLNKKEILKLSQKVQSKGVTLVPLSIYSKKNLIKVEVGLVKGKKEFEKRELIRKKVVEREVQRELRGKNE